MSFLKFLGVGRCARCGIKGAVWLYVRTRGRRLQLCVGCLPIRREAS